MTTFNELYFSGHCCYLVLAQALIFFFVNRFPFPIRFHSSRVYLYFFLCC